jgi:undecaprenyl-diphosphatase
MDQLIQAAVIGIVQGVTEFLPISSSAHLIVVPRILGWDDGFLNSATFDVMLHAGTLLALLAYFWRDVLGLIGAGWDALRERSLAGDPDRRLAAMLAVSVIPAALLGAAFEGFFDTWFRDNLLAVPVLLVSGATLLYLAERAATLVRGLDRVDLRDALVIGAAQALALFPGISRSGVTLAAGLFLGLTREAAARFAFLMGIPIIAGAGLWKARSIVFGTAGQVDVPALLVGTIAATVSGWLAIDFLLRYLRRNSTMVFIVYRLVFAAVVTVALLMR